MFGGLFNSRLKAAEKALSEGRLEEAYRLAIQPDLRDHRRGAAVLSALTEKFVERARSFYRGDRFAEAVMDLDRAEAGGEMKDEIAELRQYVQTVATEHQRHERSRHERIQEAVKRIEDGSLDAGRHILEKAPSDDQAVQDLQRKAAERAQDVDKIIEQAQRQLAAGQLAAAVERVRRAKSLDAHHPGLTNIETRLCESALTSARGAIEEGKLARAADELVCLGELGAKLPVRRELSDLLALAQQARTHLANHDYAEARRHMMGLAHRLPRAKWISEVLELLQQLDEKYAALCAGPLGDRLNHAASHGLGPARTSTQPEGCGPLDDTVPLPARIGGHAGALPEKLLLLVDGGGSFLLLRGASASLGRAASAHPADIPVFSDIAEHHANLQRVDEDYFLFASKEAEVGGRRVQHQLLRDGDRVMLGKKAKFTFRVPSRKSPSAVLELSDTTKMPNDVRRVVLFHQHATLGNGPTAHIHCRHAALPLVLYGRGGELWIRRQSDGHVDTEPKPLRLGESVEIGGVSLVLQAWKVGGATGAMA